MTALLGRVAHHHFNFVALALNAQGHHDIDARDGLVDIALTAAGSRPGDQGEDEVLRGHAVGGHLRLRQQQQRQSLFHSD